MNRLRTPILVASLCLGANLAMAQDPTVQPLPLEFLPPALGERDICAPPARRDRPDDLTVTGDDDELTNEERIIFLSRDIRNLMREDAARYFDFIEILIARRAAIDEAFDEIDAGLARVTLHLRAGLLDELHDSGLVPGLRVLKDQMADSQKMELAQLYRNGIGVSPDAAFARSLTLDAAYAGHADALLEIARMQATGETLPDWEVAPELTLTVAFGGLLGELTPGICGRAERVAQEFLKGEIVQRNPDIALAWRRFAADLGGAEAAWRVVETHLNAEALRKDNAEMLHYLRRAVDLGLALDSHQQGQVIAQGRLSEAELAQILGFNHSQDGSRTGRSVVPFLELAVNIDGMLADEDGRYLDYLREISVLADAPGKVFLQLAKETLVRRGRWAGEAEAMSLLIEAVRRDDPEAMQMLARMLVRYRDDPEMVNRAENLLLDSVDRFGMVSSLDKLDTLYRCQVNDAPRMAEATHWARAYAAAGHASVTISATDLLALDPFKAPETIARIQSQALSGRSGAVAAHVQRVMANPLVPEAALDLWARRLDRSNQALEAFAELHFDLATTPRQRAQAVELFRRVYLNNGVTTALDLAIALVEDNGRDTVEAGDILNLLTMAGNRGEGAAIRLRSRLTAKGLSAADYAASARTTYAEFAEVIEARGDFLALMFAIPFLPEDKLDDYIDRAVSLMNCGTKDADELGDAYALRGDDALSSHWRRVGLHMDGGHVLSKLRLSDRQMADFAKKPAPSQFDTEIRAAQDGDAAAGQRLFALTANPDQVSYDPKAAAQYLLAALTQRDEQSLQWALRQYRLAGPEVRDAMGAAREMRQVFRAAAEVGDAAAQFELGMLLRTEATDPADLVRSAQWLRAAADSGHGEAMIEAAFAFGLGVGVEADTDLALAWLEQAAVLRIPRAAELSVLISAASGR